MPGKSGGKSKYIFGKILIIILLIIAVTAVILKIAIPGFNFKIPFMYNTKTSSTEIILTEIHKISTLSTVEYIYKSVFPFDFLEQDTNWKELLIKRTKKEFLTEKENDKLWLFDQCRSMGINLDNEIYDFVVITSIVEAGLNLADKMDSEDIVIEGKNITIKIPRTIITKFTIEDSDSSKYKYPDLNVNPMQWKEITKFVEEKIRIKVLEDGILKNAEERGNEFIKSLLIETGWENVVFIK